MFVIVLHVVEVKLHVPTFSGWWAVGGSNFLTPRKIGLLVSNISVFLHLTVKHVGFLPTN